MKGQFFIIGAVFIVLGIITIKGMIGFLDTASEKGFGESSTFDKNIENIKNEYRYIAGISSMQSNVNASGIMYLENFTNLIRNNLDSKILYIYIFTNSSTNKYSVTTGNFLNDRINILVNVTGSTTAGYLFGLTDDKTNVTAEFQASPGGVVNITLTYSTQTEQVIELFSANTSKNSVIQFTDITLYSDNILLRTKDIFNRTC
jgi:hypothetical protein